MRKFWNENKIQLWILFAGILLISLPLATDYVHESVELINTVSRITAVSEGLFSVFPIRIVPLPTNELGYSAASFQADFFYLIPGLFHRAGIGLIGTLKATMILINLVTAGIAYGAFCKMTGSRNAGVFMATAYLLSPVRIHIALVDGSLSKLFALTFLPLIALGLSRLYEEQRERSAAVVIPLTLGSVCTLLSDSSAFFVTALAGILFVLFQGRKTLSRKVWIPLAESALGTLFLSTWYLIPLVGRLMEPSSLPSLLPEKVRDQGVYLIQYFRVFVDEGESREHFINGLKQAAPAGPGIAVMGIVLLMIVSAVAFNEKIKERSGVLVAAVVCMLMSSNLMPWDRLYTGGRIGNMILALMEAPYLFCIPAGLLLICAAGCFLEKKDPKWIYIPCVLTGLLSQYQIDRIMHTRIRIRNDRIREYVNSGLMIVREEGLKWRIAEGITVLVVIAAGIAILVWKKENGKKKTV